MIATDTVSFESPFHEILDALSRDPDAVGFGAIGLDPALRVRTYNAYESQAAGLSRERVIGRPMFTEVAPCMNNYLVGQRFVDGGELDEIVDYVLTLRMRPTRVKLRLLASPTLEVRWVLVKRN